MTTELRSRLEHLIGTFETPLVEKGYTPGTIKTYRVLLRHLATRVEAAGIEPADLTAERAAELVHDTERWRREPNKCQIWFGASPRT